MSIPAPERETGLDVSGLPTSGFGSRATTWWGTLAYCTLEGMAFALAIGSYLYLAAMSTEEWPLQADPPNLLPGTLITFFMLASLLPNWWLKRRAEQFDLPNVRIGLVVMSLAGLVILGVRVFEFPALNIWWDTNAYGSILWLIPWSAHGACRYRCWRHPRRHRADVHPPRPRAPPLCRCRGQCVLLVLRRPGLAAALRPDLLGTEALSMDAATLDALIASTRCFGGASYDGWTLDIGVTAPLALFATLYAMGTARLWRRAGTGHGVRAYEILLFAAGWLVMAGALVSPLHALSRELFAAHMIEHELMMLTAAPLLVLARPLGPLLWAFPLGWRKVMGGAMLTPMIAGLSTALTLPLTATVLHGAAMWLWHEPRLFAAALRMEWLHWLQHLGFFLSALLFWWVLLGRREVDHGRAMAHLFVTSLHTSLLGILLTFAPRLSYGAMPAAGAWGLSPLEDQQLAGLIMWIPGGLVYAGAALALAAKWILVIRSLTDR